MNSPKRVKPDVVTYGDHEIITPTPASCARLVRAGQRRASDDPVARAEEALAQISGEFSDLDDTTNASGSTRRAARSRKSA